VGQLRVLCWGICGITYLGLWWELAFGALGVSAMICDFHMYINMEDNQTLSICMVWCLGSCMCRMSSSHDCVIDLES